MSIRPKLAGAPVASNKPAPRRQLALEDIEPRILLSADHPVLVIAGVSDAPPAVAATPPAPPPATRVR